MCVQSLGWEDPLEKRMATFSRQEYWSRLPFSSPGDLPNPGTVHTSPVSPALVGRFFTTGSPGKLLCPVLNEILETEFELS